MHQPTALVQEHHMQQQQQHSPISQQFVKHSPTHAPLQVSANEKQTSLSQRLWRFVRESVLSRPRRKVRSASYSPHSSFAQDERPRDSKRRAKSCGQATEQRCRVLACADRPSSTQAVAATTAHAWRKSKMLQELEASTERSWRCCVPTTAVLRSKRQQQFGEATDARVRGRSALHRTCRNCAQRVFALSDAARDGAFFCSLDCKSSFEYLASVQRLVDDRIDEHESRDEALDALCATR